MRYVYIYIYIYIYYFFFANITLPTGPHIQCRNVEAQSTSCVQVCMSSHKAIMT